MPPEAQLLLSVKSPRATSALEGAGHYRSSLIPRNRYLVIIAVAALLLSLVELTEVVQLPFEGIFGGVVSSSFVSANSIVTLISTQGYLSLFVLMVLESASLPIPSEVVLPFAGYLVYLGSMNFALALLDSTLAGVIGALIIYYLALRLGRPFVDSLLRRFGMKPQTIDGAEKWMSTRGSWSVLVARFIPGLRSIISVPAGVFAMRIRPFVAMTLIGSFAWSAILIYLGYSAGQLWSSALASSSSLITNVVLALVAALSVAYIGYYYITRSRRQDKQYLRMLWMIWDLRPQE